MLELVRQLVQHPYYQSSNKLQDVQVTEIDEKEIEQRAGIVADTSGGIVPYSNVFYVHSIAYSAGRAREAFIRYDVGRATESSDVFIVSAVHEALFHAASLSRFFWPSKIGGRRGSNLRRLKEMRAQKLRDAFQLREDSPLKDRDLRDDLEHFDERLDLFLLSTLAGDFFPDPIVGRHTMADKQPRKVFKLVDPEASCFVLLGKKHFFAPVRNEVFRVYDMADRMHQKGGQLAL